MRPGRAMIARYASRKRGAPTSFVRYGPQRHLSTPTNFSSRSFSQDLSTPTGRGHLSTPIIIPLAVGGISRLLLIVVVDPSLKILLTAAQKSKLSSFDSILSLSRPGPYRYHRFYYSCSPYACTKYEPITKSY